MRGAGFIVTIAALMPLAGCADFDPYATTPLATAEGVKDPGSRVAVCYNAMWTSKERVMELAQRQCTEDQIAKPLTTDWHVQVCPLLVPARANFVCTPKG